MKFFDNINNVPIGEFLIEKGVITKKQLDHALNVKSKEGGLLGIILEKLGYADNKTIEKYTKIRQIMNATSIIFKFILLQLPIICFFSYIYDKWLLGLGGISIIILAAFILSHFFSEKRIVSYLYAILLIVMTTIFINVTNRELQGHIFPVIISGILLLYRDCRLFVVSAITATLYYIVSFFIQDYYLIAFQSRVNILIPLIQVGIIFLQSSLFFILAKFMENEWKERINLSYDIKIWRDKHKKEKLKLGISDISQIMYLHTIAQGINYASSTINENTSQMSKRSNEQVKQVKEIIAAIREVTDFF